jgi:2-C-methyl-D-erythritol 4-phosphate cytidylyltransferase/2-C-methyl-D-erythritol 2,4-cyclodiphosphate synthase
MKHFAIIVAAGKSERMGSTIPKSYLKIAEKTILEHSLKIFLEAECIKKIVVVLAENDPYFHTLPISQHPKIIMAIGGETRLESSLNGLKSLSAIAFPEDWIWEHDAARPCFDQIDFEQALQTLEKKPQGLVLGFLAIDTLKQINTDLSIQKTLDRRHIWHAATPQIFPYGKLELALLEAKEKNLAITDSASALELMGASLQFLQCSRKNIKVTEPDDLQLAGFYLSKAEKNKMRIGHGMDVHVFKTGRDLILGGVKIPHHQGLDGHSDADVVIHALCDALLGALALGDIGKHFPDTDPKYKGINSRTLLKHVNNLIKEKGYVLQNADIIIAAQAPKLASYIVEMRQNLAEDINTAVENISIKATTTEKLGFVGREEGISVDAVVLVEKINL